jgi:hypothetical protein
MDQQNNEEALGVLRKVGFTVLEIARLTQLHQDYGTSPLDQASLDDARLRFFRWLVATGRLTDQLPEDDASDKPKQVTQEDTSSQLDEVPLDHETGKPMDQVTQENTLCVSPPEKKPILQMVAARLNMKRFQHWLPPPSLVLYHFTVM